jgi:hypothetical protein
MTLVPFRAPIENFGEAKAAAVFLSDLFFSNETAGSYPLIRDRLPISTHYFLHGPEHDVSDPICCVSEDSIVALGTIIASAPFSAEEYVCGLQQFATPSELSLLLQVHPCRLQSEINGGSVSNIYKMPYDQ